ncbi:MAG: hypothetical protein H0X37_17905 [Herpetosiphonaceae bacterium]|nr:hypothetical protein [Herpetosiphonaceae bacterium]
MTRIAEIIESTTTTFTAGSYELLAAPAFGSLVRAEGRTSCSAYGLVYAIHTGSPEQGGRAVVRGREGMYDGDIYAANPDLEAVLQTEFMAATVGYCDGPLIRQHLPAQPPPVHYSVYTCDADELVRFTKRFDFLRSVLYAGDLPSDELIGAFLRQAGEAHTDPYAFLITAGRQLATLLRDDHQRLMALIEQIRPAM